MAMIRTIWSSLVGFFFPSLCVVCKSRLEDFEHHLCLSCLSDLPQTNFVHEPNNRFEQVLAGRVPFVRAASFGQYVSGGRMQTIVHEMKYHDNPSLCRYMGLLCGNELDGSEMGKTLDYIVPVPLHAKRQRTRGYNQSYEIAKSMGRLLNIPVDYTTLIRQVNNPSQAQSNSSDERWQNVKNIFQLTNTETFAGKHVLLVDDVFTTGATIESCVHELLKSPSVKISIYTLAWVEH